MVARRPPEFASDRRVAGRGIARRRSRDRASLVAELALELRPKVGNGGCRLGAGNAATRLASVLASSAPPLVELPAAAFGLSTTAQARSCYGLAGNTACATTAAWAQVLAGLPPVSISRGSGLPPATRPRSNSASTRTVSRRITSLSVDLFIML